MSPSHSRKKAAKSPSTAPKASKRWAVFLDRDGVLVEYEPYLIRPSRLRLIPGAARALRDLKRAGARLIVVSNQSAVARGLATRQSVYRVHARLKELLGRQHARLDAILFCPHYPKIPAKPRAPKVPLEFIRDCDCRKPSPGMLLSAAKRFNIDLGASFMVGDNTADIRTAENAGCRGILVRTGLGGSDGNFGDIRPYATAADIAGAARRILSS